MIRPLVLLIFLWVVALVVRSPMVIQEFHRLTGYPHGRPGYVVDHRIPLCAGGPDALDNLQWQALAESKVKDRFEDNLCQEMRRQGYHLVKQTAIYTHP